MKKYSKNETGVVLLISLLLLLVVALTSLGAMNTSNIESQMARNTQLQTQALAEAEIMLDTAENAVETLVNGLIPLDFSINDQYYLSNSIDPSQTDWSSFTHYGSGANKYVVEYAGNRTIPGESSEAGAITAGARVHLFQVSAQAATAKGSKRNIQSVYVTLSGP